MSKEKPVVLVVANDAGGAEIVGAYVKKNWDKKEFHAYVGGPAVSVFRRLEIPAKKIADDGEVMAKMIEKHPTAKLMLLSAPGWMSHREWHALEQSKKAGLKTALYFDSWQNYRECLGYPNKNWKDNIPDEIWVGDMHAREMAKKYFKHIRYVPNEYFKDVRERFVALKKKTHMHNGSTALFVSSALQGTEESLEVFLKFAERTPRAFNHLIVRFHPSDDRRKYNDIIQKYRSVIEIEKSTQKDIVADLARSQLVFGVETVAMVLAVSCKIKTICFLAKGYSPLIPYDQIIRIRLNKHAPLNLFRSFSL